MPELMPFDVRLWEGDAPLAMGNEVRDVPHMHVFPALRERAVGTAVVVFPGGGYGRQADHEIYLPAWWLNAMGVTALVLRYRVNPYRHPAPLLDAARAVRTARARAEEWGIAKDRVGAWGFSAGGHCAATLATHFDAGIPEAADVVERESSRPDFLALTYPVITFTPPFAHMGSRNNLLGQDPGAALVHQLSLENSVRPDTPPTFLYHGGEDTAVPPENSVNFYLALRRAGVPAELHVYGKGGHGGGMAEFDPVLRSWPDRLAGWMRMQGLLEKGIAVPLV